MHVKKNNKNACTVSWLCYSPYMTDLHDFIKVRPEELIDSLADGPRAGQFNPSPEEVQELRAEGHAEEHPTQHSTDDDERPTWTSAEWVEHMQDYDERGN